MNKIVLGMIGAVLTTLLASGITFLVVTVLKSDDKINKLEERMVSLNEVLQIFSEDIGSLNNKVYFLPKYQKFNYSYSPQEEELKF